MRERHEDPNALKYAARLAELLDQLDDEFKDVPVIKDHVHVIAEVQFDDEPLGIRVRYTDFPEYWTVLYNPTVEV